MEGEVKNFFHMFVMVMFAIAFYNVLVRQFTPTAIQTAIGI
jgi:hypothetical protein